MVRDDFIVILSFLLFVFPGYAYSQIAPNTDSLQAELVQATGEERINILLELGDQIRRSNIDSAIIYTRQALNESMRIENETLEAKSHNNLGWFLTDKGDYPAALKHLLEAKRIFEQVGNLQREALALQNLGKLYKSQSNYSKALEYYFSALNLGDQLQNKQRIANILLSIGSLNYQMDQPEESIKYYERALKLSEETKNTSDIAIIATDMGSVYSSMGDTKRAVEAYNKALVASEELPGAHAKATILMHLSSVYNDNNSYQQALEINNQALSLAREMEDKMLESWALENIAETYRGAGNYANAIKYLILTLPLLQDIGRQESVIKNRNRLARNYFDRGEFKKSIDQSEQAFEIAREAKAFSEGWKALRLLSEAYQQTGDYEKAIAAQEKIITLKDSSFSREQARQIAEMQTRYETNQKEQEITLLQNEKEKAELIRNAFIAGLLLIFIIGFLIYNRQRLKIKKNRTDLENKRLKEWRLKQDLEVKNKQLTTHSLNLVQKNELLKDLKQNISEIRETSNGKIQKKLQKVEHLVDYSFNLDEDWEEFKLYFEEVHTGFFEALKSQYQDLTPNELRLSALVKLNLTIKEIATIMGISPDSVKTARYRLRKKLDMETEENLTEFMMNVEKEVREAGSGRKGDGQ